MRVGACAPQQTLSAEAASVLKHSLSLARRRGHAQVTPLHVGATLLSSKNSLLKRACLKSQPHHPTHPLQCRALELCFNVALNRLPATPAPCLQAQPSLSNALVAALKRAQAHQRRGCIEQQQQQQPVIAIKVELEQLILSILDDPSVSRVMREAGFSSSLVKNSLEDCNSVSSVFQCYNTPGGIYSTPNSPPTETHREGVKPAIFWHSHLFSYPSEQNPCVLSPLKMTLTSPVSRPYAFKEDIKVALEVLLTKNRRNTVIVGDSVSVVDGLVAEFMGNLERGDVPDELKFTQLIKFQFSSVPLSLMKREQVEMNIADLKRKVDSFASGGGVIIYTGNLKWTIEGCNDERENGFSTGKEAVLYSPIDHLVTELAKLLSWYNSSDARVWLIATANYKTYLKCKMKQPPLDLQWSLQAVCVPSGGLGLSLNATSGQDSTRDNFPRNLSQNLDKKPVCLHEDEDEDEDKDEDDVLTCCQACKSNYENEAGLKSFSLHPINKETENGSSQLPFWLKPHAMDTSMKENLVQLRRKYNKLCRNLHQGNRNLTNASSATGNQSYLGGDFGYPLSNPSWPNKNMFADSETISFAYYPRFRRQQSCHLEFSFSNGGGSKYQLVEPNLDSLKETDEEEVKITLALGNLTYADVPISEKLEFGAGLAEVLRENVPWQCDSIPLILEALVDSRAVNEDKFVLIHGNDSVGIRRLAVGIAKVMFGSPDLLFCMKMRKNANGATQQQEVLEKALSDHERLVVLVENMEFAKFLADGYVTRKLEMPRRNGKSISQAIFILTIDGDNSCNIEAETSDAVIQLLLFVSEAPLASRISNPVHKRKVDWDFPKMSKTRKKDEFEIISSHAAESNKGEFIRLSTSNTLDLNVKADEEEEKEGKPEFTGSLEIVEKINNCVVLNRDSNQEKHATEMFLSKFKRSLQEVSGSRSISSFHVEEEVLHEILQGSGFYLNSLFEQWLNEVFHASLQTLDTTNKGARVSISLCLGGKGETGPEDGFMGTNLPKRIHVKREV